MVLLCKLLGGVWENEEGIKGLWTASLIPMSIPIRLFSIFIMYGNQVCKNVDDGLTEVCAIQQLYHKPEDEEYAVDVDTLTFCLTLIED